MEREIQIKAKNIFLDVVKQALSTQNCGTGEMPSGHNGPYYDQETPIRNTSHWAISFIKAYELTDDIEYKEAARKCYKYLAKNFVKGKTYVHRKNENKDQCNGLIGPAWNIESFVEGYNFFNDANCLEIAENIQKLIPFDEKVGLWQKVEIDGKILKYDMTFNHQLWYAASLALLYSINKSDEIEKQVEIFLSKLKNNFRIHRTGLVKHAIIFSYSPKLLLLNFFRKIKIFSKKIITNKSFKYKEEGYHLFNLFAFAIINEIFPNHNFYKSRKFRKALNFSFSDTLYRDLKKNNYSEDITNLPVKKEIEINRYGFAYNAPGFEILYIYKVFKPLINEKYFNFAKIINDQLNLTFNNNTNTFSKNTEDYITLTSRIYELSRIL